jgi:hypothetical protein
LRGCGPGVNIRGVFSKVQTLSNNPYNGPIATAQLRMKARHKGRDVHFLGTKCVVVHTLSFDDNRVLNGQLRLLMFKLSVQENLKNIH